MATVSSYLVVIASGLVRDVYLRFINPHARESTIRWLSHLMMVVVGVGAVAANLRPPHHLQTMVILSGTCAATSFFAPAMMIAYWRRATAAGVMAAMAAGVISSLSLYAAGWLQHGNIKPVTPLGLDPIIWGLAISSFLGVATSLCTAPPAEKVGLAAVRRRDAGERFGCGWSVCLSRRRQARCVRLAPMIHQSIPTRRVSEAEKTHSPR